ncbi:MAG: 1-acyl-sn-glycerol-3-phosphate acyltransferase [Lachnospiraceae bacterium]|nr:1-acyl-sn-glycerol-3-phosphate acyltransferase [Lachnospiraceae bacterium]
MIRFILSALYLLLYLIITLPLELILFVIGKFNMPLRDKISMACVKNAGFKVVAFLSGANITVKGLENIPDDTACLFVGNHNSFFDVIIGYTLMKRPTGFLAKKEFRKYPSLNVWMYYIRCLFLDRKDVKQGMKTILKAVEYLKSGINIFVFPEGSRSRDGKMLPFKEGSMKMAEKSGCPVIPVSISGTAAVFEDHFPRITKENVSFTFGKPIYIKDLEGEDKKHPGRYVQEIIRNTLEEQTNRKEEK